MTSTQAFPGLSTRQPQSPAGAMVVSLAETNGVNPRVITPAQVVAAVRQLPALPRSVAGLLELFQGKEPDVQAVSDLIGRDQALTARVLRLANSPWYGMSGRINSVQEAILVLGLNTVRNLALAASLTSAFPALRAGWFNTDVFWRHCIAVAVCARQLAMSSSCGISPDLAYCAGLLHDIGQVALAAALPAEYEEIVRRRDLDDLGTAEAEHRVLGVDHAQVGASLAHHWHFSALLEQSIRGHHAPPQQEGASLADVVHAADLLAHALDLAGDDREAVGCPCEPAWRRLGLNWEKLRQALPDVEQQAHHAAAALGLAQEAP